MITKNAMQFKSIIKKMAKTHKTDTIAENIGNRNFEQELRKVILTDITYRIYKGKKALKFLTIKDKILL